MLLLPELFTRTWLGGRDAQRTSTKVITAGFGARDLAIGVGTARALGAGYGARPWLLAGVVGDLADLVATLRGRDDLPAVGVATIAVIASGSTALGVWLLRALD